MRRAILNKGTPHTDYRRQPIEYLAPRLSFIARAKELPTSCSEVNSNRVERIYGHGIAQDCLVRLLLRQPPRKGLPRGATVVRSINAQPAIARASKLVRLHRNDVHAVRVSGMHDHGKTEIRRHAIGDIR